MATTITKTLQLGFTSSDDKTTHIVLSGMKEDLTEAAVLQAMQDISSAQVFERKGVDLYKAPKSANYIERHVTPVYQFVEVEQAN